MQDVIDLKFERPPVNEVGISLISDCPIVDPFDVMALHDQMLHALPEVQRHPPIGEIKEGVFVSLAPLVRETDVGIPPRWWFVSEDGKRVLQLQERFLSWNWRRGGIEEQADYPGFDKLVDEAFPIFESVLARAPADGRIEGWQLLYENHIPILRDDGSTKSLSDLLSHHRPGQAGPPMFGWSQNWIEPIIGLHEATVGGRPEMGKPVVSSELNLVGTLSKTTGKLVPMLRAAFVAVGRSSSLDDTREQVELAHMHIRALFLRILADDVKNEWGAL